ncbi:MAG TPA: cytochrome c family protein [Hyphomicrobiales bacterium]|nr:cytochrome c family protein [Hyphomicrobiales bacterium]
MDSFEVNKILGAILGTLTFTLAISIGATLLFENNKPPAKAGFAIAVPKGGTETAAAAPKVEPIANRLAKADPKKGEALTKQCQSCHNFQEGQGKKVGPDLYGVVGRPIASKADFSYSSAIKKLADKQKTWTFANLDEWLDSPSTDAPGTAMTFAGITRPDQRADVIAYLNQNSAKPLPLPKPEAAPAAPSKANPAPAAGNIKAGAEGAAAEQQSKGAAATGEPFQSKPGTGPNHPAPAATDAGSGKAQPPAANPAATQPAPAGTQPTAPAATQPNQPKPGTGGMETKPQK